MKLYRYGIILLFLSSTIPTHTFWDNWFQTISAKINNTTEFIMHREFPKVQRLEINNEQGSIIINSWKQDTIAIEIITCCSEASLKNIKNDMQQINDIIKIHTTFTDPKIKGSVTFNILVPKDVNLMITTQQGDIIVKDMHSSLELQSESGNIKLLNPQKNIHAQTTNGSIIIRTDCIEQNKEFNLMTEKGNIEIYTTSTINAQLNAHALNGKVTSDLPITLDSKTTKLDAAAWKCFRQSVQGSIGIAQSKIVMHSEHGSIIILPYTKQNDIF